MNKDDVFQMAKAIAEANRHPAPDEYASTVAETWEANTAAPAAPEPE